MPDWSIALLASQPPPAGAGIGWEAWFAMGVVVLVLALLAWNRIGTDVVIVGGVSLLVFAGVLSPKAALAGMANEGMATVGVLYVVVAGLTETGAVLWLARRVLGRPRGELGAMLRMFLPVTTMSAFMNNTPLVAMFIPALADWCRKHRISPSRLMIPLSYAAILGGTITLIGTSTNLVVSGMWKEQVVERGEGAPMRMFDIARLGIPCAIVGLIYIATIGRRFLPERVPVLSLTDDPRSYTVEMLVEPGGPLVASTIESAGLRHLPGLYLAEIDRGGVTIAAVGPEQRLEANDRLVFVGAVDSVVDLQKIRGLAPATSQIVKLDAPRPQRTLVEAVLSNSSPLVGRTIREGRFRSVYDAVVIAVARNGERLRGKIGDIQLRTGDTLLLEAPRSFVEQHRTSRDFFLTSPVQNSAPLRHERAPVALGILALMVALATLTPLSMLHAAVLAAGLMILTRCCTGSSARGAVDWQVLVVIAASLALGKGIEVSGAADAIAERMMALALGNPLATLAMIYLVTMLFTEVVTNNAAVVLTFAIAHAAAGKMGVDFRPFAMCIMMAGSASFSTPIGYQTNLMVMSPGGYRFTDYPRIGIPLNLLMMAITVPLAAWIWPLTPG